MNLPNSTTLSLFSQRDVRIVSHLAETVDHAFWRSEDHNAHARLGQKGRVAKRCTFDCTVLI